MQLRFVFLIILHFFFTRSFASPVLEKVVSLQLENETIEAGLRKLQKDYQVYFSYINKIEQLQNKVNLSLKNVNLNSALQELFYNTNISYYELYDQVVLIEKDLAAKYQLDLIDSMQHHPDTIRIFNVTYLPQNTRENRMSVADLWQAIMLQKIVSEYDSGFTWARYDTLANADTVKIMIDSVREKPQLKITLKASEKLWQHSLTLRPDFMITRWQMSSDNIAESDLNDINDYGQAEVAFSAELLYTLRYRFLSLQTGVGLSLIRKESRHKETLINLANNNAESIRYDRNSSQYNYIQVPLLAGFNLGWENMFFRVSGGMQFNYLSSSAGANFYPVYENIYYNTTLNLLYDKEGNLLENQEINLRKSFTSLRLQVMSFFQMNDHFYFTGGIIFRDTNTSIYEGTAAPVQETFSGFALSAGLSYLF
jgi:hypothetical protein